MNRAKPSFDKLTNTWTIRSPDDVESALNKPELRVRPSPEPIPLALVGSRAGEIFGNLARMTDGASHEVRRSVVDSIIGALNLEVIADNARSVSLSLRESAVDLHDWVVNVSPYALGKTFGVAEQDLPVLARNVARFSRAISPGASATEIETGVEAANFLWESFSNIPRQRTGDSDLLTSNLIGLFFQGFEGMAGLLGNSLIYLNAHPETTDVRTAIRHVMHESPSIKNTRRFANSETHLGDTLIAADSTLLIDLEAATTSSPSSPSFAFGAGAHACPGQLIAFTIATAALEVGPRLIETPQDGFTYFPYPNVRVPNFRGISIARSNA